MSLKVSGKKVVILIIVSFIAMAATILPNMLNQEVQLQAEENIKGAINIQYKIKQKEIEELVKQEKYVVAIESWKKFLKKFSYRNHWKEKIIEDIKLMKNKLKTSKEK